MLWTLAQAGQRHELAAAHCYGWTCLAPGEVAQVVIERGDARSVWRVERRVQGVKATEVRDG